MDFRYSLVKIFVDLLIEDVIDKLIGRTAGSLSSQQLANSLSNGLDLALEQISIELDLTLGSSGDDLNEDSEVVAILSLNIDRDVNQSSSLSDGLLDLVSSQFELIK